MKTAHEGEGKDALFLTGMALLSQVLGFCYRVALSRTVGAEVMGLYQLLMPVYSVLLSLTAVGLTAAASNLSARHLALGSGRGMEQTRRYCLLLMAAGTAAVAAAVTALYDPISVFLLGDARTQLGLILLLPCVLLTGVENIHKHIFYGAGLVRPPAFTELAEQGIRAGAVLGLLFLFLPQNPERTVGLIVAGMILCEIFSALTLPLLYRKFFQNITRQGKGERAAVVLRQVGSIALPVGCTALLGNLMGAANAALIPQKLVEGGMSRGAAVSEFGVICGMTLPMLSLPTVFLGALNLVVMPQLARASALGQREQIRRRTKRTLETVSMLIMPAMALMAVLGEDLAAALFDQPKAGEHLLPLALAVIFSSFHSVLAGVLNAAEHQQSAALVSLLCDGVQLMFVFAVARFGIAAFVAGTLVSAALGAALCAVLAKRGLGVSFPLFSCLVAPGLGALLAGLTGNLLFLYLKGHGLSPLPAGGITAVYCLLLYLAALQAQGVEIRRGSMV